MNEIQKKIAALKAKGWLTSQIALAANVSPSTIARWADGEPHHPIAHKLIDTVALMTPPERNLGGRPLGSKTTAKKAKKKGKKK